MASPFRVFRRHQKGLLASLTLLAMVSFIFLPMFMRSDNRANVAVTDPVVVKSKYGKLRRSDVDRLLQERALVNNFLRSARDVAFTLVQPKSEMEKYMLYQRKEQNDRGSTFGPRVGERDSALARHDMLETWLLAQRAADVGLEIPNEDIIRYTNEQTLDVLSPQQVAQLVARLNTSEEFLFFHAMRRELLAEEMKMQFIRTLEAATPAQRYQYFLRLNRQAGVELAAVPAEKYVAKVADPDEKTLREFFDQYKNQLSQPGSPEPGFRQPYRATIEYLKGDIKKFLEPKAIAEADIEQYYDKHKENYVQPQLPTLDEKKPAEPEKKAETPASAAKAKPQAKPSPEPAHETTKPAKEPLKAAPPAEKKGPADTSKKSSSVAPRSLFHLTAQKEEKADPAAAKGAPPKAAEQKPAQTKPAEQKPAEQKPAAASAKPAESKPAKPAENAESKQSQIKYIPLEKVKEEIRGILAKQKASAKMHALLEPLRNQLRAKSAEAQHQESPEAIKAELVKFNLQEKAKKDGLEYGRLDMVAIQNIQDSDLGQSMTTLGQPFWQYELATPGLGRPAISEDVLGNKYVAWKIDEQAEHVPNLNDKGIRDQVVLAWKKVQARKLAGNEATQLAAKARAEKKPLKESLQGVAGITVSEPRPFSWMTNGNVPMYTAQAAPQLSEVEGVDAAGENFMAAVFALEPGQVGLAVNEPKTVVYVVRLDSYAPSQTVLWARFTTDDYQKYAQVAIGDERKLFQAWLQEIRVQSDYQVEASADQDQLGRSAYASQQSRQSEPYDDDLD